MKQVKYLMTDDEYRATIAGLYAACEKLRRERDAALGRIVRLTRIIEATGDRSHAETDGLD